MKSMRITSETSWYLLVSLCNGLIASLVCLQNFPEEALFWSIQSLLFSVSATMGHFIFLFLLCGLPFWALGNYTEKKALGRALILGVNMILIMLIYLDSRIFDLYKFHLNGMVIELITGGALQDNLSFNALVWLLFLAIALIFVAAEIFLGRMLFSFFSHSHKRNLYSAATFGLFILCALLSQTIYIYSDAKGDTTITSLKRYIPWAQTITAKRKLRELGVEVKETQNQKISYRLQALDYPKNPLTCEAETNYNVLIVVVDSLRSDMLDSEVMPNLWQLSQSSHTYTQHYSMANSTRFGLFTLMYGLTGNYWHGMLEVQKGSAFIDQFLEKNYALYINSAAPLYSPEFDRTIFTKVKDQLVYGPSNAPAHKKDAFITEDFLKKIEKHPENEPFFSFLFYDSPHSYSYPSTFKEKFLPSWNKINYLELDNHFDPSEFFNRYKNSAHYADSLIGEVIDKLKQNQLLKNTIVVFTSDHGQEFNETKQNFWGHNGNFSSYQTQVPFFIYWPTQHPLHGKRLYQQQTASVDLVPTLMSEGLACSNPVSDYSSGINLYASQNNYARPLLLESWSKRAIMGKDYIMVFHDAGGNEIFDRSYKKLSDFKVPQKDFSTIFKQISEFHQ
jgi:membrane-anchored protein YejM (alkaline phosphatase superfamily)